MKICVYGASGDRLRQEYFDAAYALGALMAENGHTLIYGGGQTGLMGAVGRGAHDKGGEIIGVAPKFFDEPGVLSPDCTEFIFTETMRERKHIMEDMADAFIVLPGGIGTFEEFFETLTLKQLGRHRKPIAIYNIDGYYDLLVDTIKYAIDTEFIKPNCERLFAVFDETQFDSMIDYIENDNMDNMTVKDLK